MGKAQQRKRVLGLVQTLLTVEFALTQRTQISYSRRICRSWCCENMEQLRTQVYGRAAMPKTNRVKHSTVTAGQCDHRHVHWRVITDDKSQISDLYPILRDLTWL